MENITEAKLNLNDKLYNEHGTEYTVVRMCLHLEINYPPEWSYGAVPTKVLKTFSDGTVLFGPDNFCFIRDKDINVKYFTRRPSMAHRLKKALI